MDEGDFVWKDEECVESIIIKNVFNECNVSKNSHKP